MYVGEAAADVVVVVETDKGSVVVEEEVDVVEEELKEVEVERVPSSNW